MTEVPTVSTTLFQVIGDTLTVILCRLKGFTAADFAFLHPGGVLGRKVNLRVVDVMHSAPDLPIVTTETTLTDALTEIMAKRLGMTSVVDATGRLVGVLADGDLKRILQNTGGSIAGLSAGEVMTKNPRTVDRNALLAMAVKIMETNTPGAITFLLVVDADGRPAGVVHLHDCLRLSPADR
ncbi:MAG: CBS domain-containing protein [bacterium]|nr:CBS domain-containing protein [bacterium]